MQCVLNVRAPVSKLAGAWRFLGKAKPAPRRARVNRDPIKSSARTLQVLELFAGVRRPLRLMEILGRLDLPQSSASVLLKSMVVTGYLNYDRASRTYLPSSRVAALGDWINPYVFGPGDLTDLIYRVAEQTGETVAVSVQNDIFVQHLRILEPSHEYKNAPAEGTMRVLTESASGLALLSCMSAADVDKLARLIAAHQRARVDRPDLEAQLQWVRREGYALMAGFPIEGAAGIAVPMQQPGRRNTLVLGVGGLNSRIVAHKTRILSAMRDALDDYDLKRSRLRDPPVRPV